MQTDQVPAEPITPEKMSGKSKNISVHWLFIHLIRYLKETNEFCASRIKEISSETCSLTELEEPSTSRHQTLGNKDYKKVWMAKTH